MVMVERAHQLIALDFVAAVLGQRVGIGLEVVNRNQHGDSATSEMRTSLTAPVNAQVLLALPTVSLGSDRRSLSPTDSSRLF